MSSQTGSLAGGNVSFDLNSQSGVMKLLASIRVSALSPAQKNELRDLVFLYSNGGGDPSVRLALLKKLDTYQLVPVVGSVKPVPATEPTPVVIRPFGKTRLAPAFAPVVVTNAPPSFVPRAVTQREPVVAAPVAPAVVNVPVSDPVPRPAPAAPPTMIAPEPPPTPVPEFTAPVEIAMPVAAAASAPVGQNYLDRIRQIKHAVNEKVGNPVNLVDIDNTVGREYMVALLDAMKKVGGGMTGDIEAAMGRLEEAFVRVEQTVAAHAAHAATSTSGSVAASVVTPVPIIARAPIPTPPLMEKMIDDVSLPEASIAMVEAELPSVAAPEPTTRWGSPEVESEVREQEKQDHPPRQSPPLFRAASLAEDSKQLLTPADLPDPTTNSTGTREGDPLHTSEVDAGLDQLLQEWPIFKKSGLFGTGPKGIVHPLYKELCPLTIPLILAGRYDSDTKEIRQSITDYMNGWRYEQGLVYDQEETFEHYLRRVIRHIIDLQKRRVSA